MKMRNKINEQLERINRLMPKIISEDITATDEITDLDEVTSTGTIYSRAFEYFETAIKGKNIDISFEKLLQKWGLIVRENETLAPKIVFDKVTKRITKINWDRFTPQDFENFFKLQPFREAFEEQFIKTNRINIQQFQTDQTARDFLKNVNLKFFTAIETYINQTSNIIDKSAAENLLNKTQDYIKQLFSPVWFKGVTNWFNENIGTKRIFQIFQTNLNDAEALKLRQEGQQLMEEYNQYLANEGGMRPIETAEYEQKILNYLIKLNTYTRKKSKVIWNELMQNMPEEVKTQFFGTTNATGKVDPVFTIDKLGDLIDYFQKMNPRIKAEWTGWFQGFVRIFGDLFTKGKRLNTPKRLINMALAFETRLADELLNNVEIKGNKLGRAFLYECKIRIGVMYLVYPAVLSAWEIAKLQALQTLGYSPYFKLGWDQWYIFMVTFEPEFKDDKKEWLAAGKGEEGAAKGIWWKLFKKYYAKNFDDQNWWNAFWHSPAYEGIMKYIDDKKTSEDNEEAAVTEAERIQKETKLKFQDELRDKLYNDPQYMNIENKDSIWNIAMKHFEDSVAMSKNDTKKIIDGDVEVEDR
jgi:hypothetical protein